MSSIGPQLGGATSTSPLMGYAWTSPSNLISPTTAATWQGAVGSSAPISNYYFVPTSGGASVSGGACSSTAGASRTYGGPSSLWGRSWTLSDIKGNSSFGFVAIYQTASFQLSDIITVSGFDFTGIPAGATIDGVQFDLIEFYTPGSTPVLSVYNSRCTVYYTSSGGGGSVTAWAFDDRNDRRPARRPGLFPLPGLVVAAVSPPPPPPPATVLLEEPRVAAARRRPSPLFEPPLMTPAARPPLGWEPAPASPLAPGRRQRPPALDLPALPTARLAGWEPALDRQARRRAAAPPVTGDALPAAPTVWLDSLSGDSRRPAPPRRTAEPDPPAPPPPTTTTPAAWHELVGPARVAPARPRPSLWWPEIVPATPGPTRVFRGTAALPVTVAAHWPAGRRVWTGTAVLPIAAAPPLTLTSLAAPRVWAGTARQIMGPGSFSLEYTPGEDVTLDLTHADNLDPRSWTQAMYMAPWGGGTPQLTGATYTVLGTVPPFVTRWTIPRVDTLRQGVGYWLAQVKRIDSGNNVVLSTGKVNVTQTSQG